MHWKFVVPVCLLVVAAALAADVKVVEQIVAKVNNEIITLGDIEKSRKELEARLKQQQVPAAQFQTELKQREANLLRDRIDGLLLVQKAKDLQINVDTEVSKRMAQIQLDSKITDPEKFQHYISDNTGMSFEDFKQSMKDELMKGEVIRREVGSRIVVSRADSQKYYEEHKTEFVRQEQVVLREIFLGTDGKDAAAVEKKAKDLVARARKGENFGNLAHDNSDASTAANYGELPPFKRGELKKEIEDVVFAQQRGYVTDPLKQPNGFEILKVEEHYQSGLQPFEAVENEVMERLMYPKMEPAVRQYLTKLRQDAFLEIRPGWVDSGAAPGKDTAWKDPAKLTPQTVTKEEVATHVRRKRLLWLVPVPGTKPEVKTGEAGPAAPKPAAAAPAGTAAAAPPATTAK